MGIMPATLLVWWVVIPATAMLHAINAMVTLRAMPATTNRHQSEVIHAMEAARVL